MNIDEKLDTFHDAVMDDVANQSVAIIEKYKKSLHEIYEEHKEDTLRKAYLSHDVETQNLIREKNKALSAQTFDNKREISNKTKELTNVLFNNVTVKLQNFMKTPEYIDFLEKYITLANGFVKDEPITIYLNTSDEDKKEELEKRTGAALTNSTIDFLGGIRAVISTKSVLIDYSFATKLKEEKETFTL